MTWFQSRLRFTDDEIDQNCLRFLQCPDSQVVKNRLVEAKDKLHWESIEWVFKTPHYLSWMNETHLVILWIKGGAGKGKTMMSIGIIERLLLSIASRSNGKAPLIAYFFCQNADYRLNKLDSIIKGLIFQMIKQRPALIKCLRSHWDSKNNRFHGAMSWRKLWDIFLEMTERCQDATIYIVVDALDECQNDGISQFLRVIIRTSSLNAGKIKCLLTSRPLGDAEKELLTSKDQAQVSLELNSANVNQAIKSYITTKMEEIDRHQRLHPKLRQTVAQELVNRSDGTYLWVSLVCRDLKKTQPQEMLKRVQTLPEDLESLYKQKCAELSTGDSASMCMRMLKVVTLSFRPIHKDEFESVTGLSQKDWAIEALVARCGSFINMRGDFITFIHQSARDFLIGDNGASLLNMYEIYNHENIALRCVTFLATKLKVDLFNFVHPCSEPSRLAQLDDEQLSLFTRIRYAAQFWITHISKADSSFIQRSIGPDGLVCSFLEANILEWIEYLSWNDDILVAIEGLRTIKNINSVSKV